MSIQRFFAVTNILQIIRNTFRAQHPSLTSMLFLFWINYFGRDQNTVLCKIKKITLMTSTQTWLNLIFEFSKLVLCSIWLRLRVINELEMLPTKSEIQIVLNNTFLSLLEHDMALSGAFYREQPNGTSIFNVLFCRT